MNADFLLQKFEQAVPYEDYIAAGTPDQQSNWQKIYDQIELNAKQTSLVQGFTRPMKVIVLSGIWCGDCVQQGPLLERIAEANPAIDLRWLERVDAHQDLVSHVRINAGERVPVVIFMAEDGELVGWYGDKTLNRYRAVAARQLGASCPLPGAEVSQDELHATLQDWLNEFERVHLLLRLSARLRAKHND